jgi:tetratricopeptide (TPR) repeat protein
MKGIANYKRQTRAIRALMSDRKYAQALEELDKLLQEWHQQPALLVLRGELIQLQEENGPPLEEAADALKRATVLHENDAGAWLELAHFQFAVEDNTKAAEKSFARAVDISRETLVAALIGRAAALDELNRKSEAFDCLSAARYLQSAIAANNHSPSAKNSLFERWESLVAGM